jgi:hypothetical protein
LNFGVVAEEVAGVPQMQVEAEAEAELIKE